MNLKRLAGADIPGGGWGGRGGGATERVDIDIGILSRPLNSPLVEAEHGTDVRTGLPTTHGCPHQGACPTIHPLARQPDFGTTEARGTSATQATMTKQSHAMQEHEHRHHQW